MVYGTPRPASGLELAELSVMCTNALECLLKLAGDNRLLLQARREVCDQRNRLIDLLRYPFHQKPITIGRNALRKYRQDGPLADNGLGRAKLKALPASRTDTVTRP